MRVPSDLTVLSNQELVDLLHHREDDTAEIKQQISEAKAKAYNEGIYSDPDWFRRATSALNLKKKLIRKIQGEFERRRDQRTDVSSETALVEEVSLSELGAVGLQDYLNMYDDRRLVTVVCDSTLTFVIWRVQRPEVT